MEVISIVNWKGGVGKTTTAINLSVGLVKHGKKVLLIDADPQGNATAGIGFLSAVNEGENYITIYDIMKRKNAIVDGIYTMDRFECLDIIPANDDLANAEIELSTAFERERILKDSIEKYKEEFESLYDFIIIDNNPSLGLLTFNSMVASDSLIIPLEPTPFSIDGLSRLLSTMEIIKNRLNPNLDIKGVLLTRVDKRTNLEKVYNEQLNNIFKEKVFFTIIHQNVDISRAQEESLSVIEYNPKAKGSEEYLALAEEVIICSQKE